MSLIEEMDQLLKTERALALTEAEQIVRDRIAAQPTYALSQIRSLKIAADQIKKLREEA